MSDRIMDEDEWEAFWTNRWWEAWPRAHMSVSLAHVSGSLAHKKDAQARRPRRVAACGVCDACVRECCGVCKNCRNMTRFGGTGHRKRGCIHKTCRFRELPPKKKGGA